MMTALPEFLLAIATRTSAPEKGAGAMTIIVQRPYARLERELRSTFAGQKHVTVIVDRRLGERRVTGQPVAVERRRADRRMPKQEMVCVLLSV
jgi:hypothetical protein